jgi:hypothetical protein
MFNIRDVSKAEYDCLHAIFWSYNDIISSLALEF